MLATQREKDRKLEHERHHWYRSQRPRCARPGLVFVDCPCGWFGWITEANAPTATAPPG